MRAPLLRGIIISAPLFIILSLLASGIILTLQPLVSDNVASGVTLALTFFVALTVSQSSLWRRAIEETPRSFDRASARMLLRFTTRLYAPQFLSLALIALLASTTHILIGDQELAARLSFALTSFFFVFVLFASSLYRYTIWTALSSVNAPFGIAGHWATAHLLAHAIIVVGAAKLMNLTISVNERAVVSWMPSIVSTYRELIVTYVSIAVAVSFAVVAMRHWSALNHLHGVAGSVAPVDPEGDTWNPAGRRMKGIALLQAMLSIVACVTAAALVYVASKPVADVLSVGEDSYWHEMVRRLFVVLMFSSLLPVMAVQLQDGASNPAMSSFKGYFRAFFPESTGIKKVISALYRRPIIAIWFAGVPLLIFVSWATPDSGYTVAGAVATAIACGSVPSVVVQSALFWRPSGGAFVDKVRLAMMAVIALLLLLGSGVGAGFVLGQTWLSLSSWFLQVVVFLLWIHVSKKLYGQNRRGKVGATNDRGQISDSEIWSLLDNMYLFEPASSLRRRLAGCDAVLQAAYDRELITSPFVQEDRAAVWVTPKGKLFYVGGVFSEESPIGARVVESST